MGYFDALQNNFADAVIAAQRKSDQMVRELIESKAPGLLQGPVSETRRRLVIVSLRNGIERVHLDNKPLITLYPAEIRNELSTRPTIERPYQLHDWN